MMTRARRWTRWLTRRRDFYAHLRLTDVFLVTYPKSGTTWLAFLLANLLRPEDHAPLNLQNYLRYVPDVNDIYWERGTLRHASLPDPRFFIGHMRYDAALPHVVYIVRDPRDVLVSYWHHKRLTEPGFSLSIEAFVQKDDHWPCRWDEHVRDWLLPPRHPRLLAVKYEEMQIGAAVVLQKVLAFAGVNRSSDDVARAVEASRFERMRSAEEHFGLGKVEGVKDERFVRRGKVGGWRDELGSASVRAIERAYGPVMLQMGYETTQ